MEYAKYEWENLGESPDNGQAIIKTNVCTKPSCAKWIGETEMSPVLLRDDMGLRYCPVCNCSYG